MLLKLSSSLRLFPFAEITGGSGQVTIQVKDVEEEKGKGKGKGKKPSSKAKDLSKETVIEAKDHGAGPKVKDVPSPPLQADRQPSSRPRLLPWLAGPHPWLSATQL